jgi:hypothetical protein
MLSSDCIQVYSDTIQLYLGLLLPYRTLNSSIHQTRFPGAGPDPKGAFPCAYINLCLSSNTLRLLK